MPSAILLALISATVHAEEKTAAHTTELNKVQVSANKIKEDINKVPQSITVIDEHTLIEKDIKGVKEVVKEVPNMTSSPFGSINRVSFRGLSESQFTKNNPVVIYIDGVPKSNYYSFDASMANVQQVEVLRDPQGSL